MVRTGTAAWRFHGLALFAMVWSIGFLASASAHGEMSATRVALAERPWLDEPFTGIRLLGALRLAGGGAAGRAAHGLSDLAWDEDENVLYAVSDFGHLIHLQITWDNGTLAGARLLGEHPLRDAGGRPLRRPMSDAEGMTIRHASNGIQGDTELMVSFEGVARISAFRPDGGWLEDTRLAPPLDNAVAFDSHNHGLEAIALHPRLGLLAATERPLQGERERIVPIVSEHRSGWRYPLGSTPGSALTSMEVLGDSELLMLERAFISRAVPVVISLRRAQLPLDSVVSDVGVDKRRVPGAELLQVRDVAVLDAAQGWKLDNFEGLGRHRDNRFFMVSDDNGRRAQSTYLVYFALRATERP